MLKLHQIYLRRFIGLFFALFVVIGAVIYFWLKDIYLEQTKASLLQKIELVSLYVQNDYDLDNLALKIKKNLNVRVTIVDEAGKVIAESHEDKTKMDNHKYREEIVQANNNTTGSIIRYSHTVNKDFVYVAKKFTIEQKIYFIRVAKALSKINDQIIKLGYEIALVVVLFFLILFFIFYKLSKQLQQEISAISKFLLNLTKKRKNNYISSDFSLEFAQITKLLTKVSKVLSKKDKQKTKYTNKLKASNEQKDDIISAISHEFKNPIAVINGYSQTLIEDPDINQQIQKKFLNKIHKSGIRLSDLIDTLRLSIKLEEGKQPLQYKEINLYNLISELAESLQSNYKNRQIKILGKKEITVRADSTLLSIAIVNLIENALKYSEDTVEVEFTEKYLSVIDTGIGIKEKFLENITDKFYRVSSNGWNNSLGLGLSIVSNVVNKHNFKLQIESKENEGSTFTIRF